MSEEPLPPSIPDASRRKEHLHRVRGPRGVKGVRPYFESVDLAIELFTDEPERRVQQLIRNVEARCPVANLSRAAEVALTLDWRARPAAEADAG
ncbi:MAG TPA: hypothetical protein VKA00_00870 [Trueperaceae bacterium]|nr:hypothetical protein [Trueperaceae bacterium]